MSIRLQGRSESMGGADVVSNMTAWSLDAAGKRQAAKNFLADMPVDSTVLDQEQYETIHAEKLHATFIEDEELGLGRNESQHSIRFGQMILNSMFDHEQPDLVAVKPFIKIKDLYTEWSANTYVNAVSGEQKAFLPLGIWRRDVRDEDDDATYNLITLYEHGVKSFDSVFWADKSESPEAMRLEVVDNAAVLCLNGLGYLHGLGVVHGDAQAKNLARDSRGVRFIDLESASLLTRERDGTLRDDYANDNLIMRDIDHFFDSIVRVEENHADIATALKLPGSDIRYLRCYQEGLTNGCADSGLVVPPFTTTTREYFDAQLSSL